MSTVNSGNSAVTEQESESHGSSEMAIISHVKAPRRMEDVGRGHDQGDDGSDSDHDDEDAPLIDTIQPHNQAYGSVLKGTCSKKSVKICSCLLLLTTAICIIAVVAAAITTTLLLQSNSAPFSMDTTYNTTVVIYMKRFIKSYSITSTRDRDYSCNLATVTLPCSALSRSYLKNQSVDDISNDLGRLYIYLLRGSVMHFKFDSDSDCPSYTVWVFPDKLNDQVESSTSCTSLNEEKFNGNCKIFTGSGTFDYPVPKDGYYFYTRYNCDSVRPKLSLTIDYYWYNFTQYVNNSGLPTVFILPGQRQVIAAAHSFSFSSTCTLIHTPSTDGCKAVHSFMSPVDISQITLYPTIWLICIMPVVLVSLVIFIGAVMGYAFFYIVMKRQYTQQIAH